MTYGLFKQPRTTKERKGEMALFRHSRGKENLLEILLFSSYDIRKEKSELVYLLLNQRWFRVGVVP